MGESTGASYEPLIEMPLGVVEDSEGLDRIFTVVGLDSFTDGLRNVNIIQGQPPEPALVPMRSCLTRAQRHSWGGMLDKHTQSC